MAQEDKARAYDKALDRAKIYSEGHALDVNPQAAMEYVFPELRESKEEKIRNTLIDLFKNRLTYYGTEKLKDLKVDDILAWLEKQGQEKHLSEPIDEQRDNCDTCTNDKGCVTCENGELYEGKPNDYAKSNEEKAKEIADFLYFKLSHIDYNSLKRELFEMAEWKDHQFKAEKQALIDKAVKHLAPIAYTQ